jgi:hypothetical protein
VQNTTRTARALADEVVRDATEQTERGLRAQQETVRQFSDPFIRPGNGAAHPQGTSAQPMPGGAQPPAGQKEGQQRSTATH